MWPLNIFPPAWHLCLQCPLLFPCPPLQASHRSPSPLRQNRARQTSMNGTPGGTNLCNPTPRNNRKPSRLKVNIMITTLDISGFTAPSSNVSGIDKWSTINRTINKNHIAILTLQETHLDPSLLQNVVTCFGKRLEILISAHPENPHSTAGVAFVINKALINLQNYMMHELLPGWAATLKIKWLDDEELALLNVYAPNVQEENAAFWDIIDNMWWSIHLRCPDFLLGGFNTTEDKIDCSTTHLDDANATNALRALCHTMKLQDSWRHSYPTERSFTYRANANSRQIQSWLDRIYTTNQISNQIMEWKTLLTTVTTDHSLVIVMV